MRPHRLSWFGAILALAGLVLAGCSAATAPGGRSRAAPHAVTVARDGRSRAELDVVSGASTVTVSTASLGGELLRAATPANSAVRPDLVTSGPGRGNSVQLFLDHTGLAGPAAVQVVLAAGVAWQLQFSGGSSQTAADLSGGTLRGADFTAGVSVITMLLPRPQGTVTLVLAGGAAQVTLSLPAGVPARLRLDGGAGSATLGGAVYSGIAGGTVLTTPGWAAAASRYDIEAPAGISAITVTSR